MIAVRRLFKGINIKDNAILDVGCGGGSLLLWAYEHGSGYITGLEPKEKIERLINNSIRILPKKIQDYDMPIKQFDIIVLQDSINHLDENSCIWLRKTHDARNKYRAVFKKLYRGLKSGGKLIITDCSNRNFFADLHVINPFCPSIEWHKHQTPELWAKLLSDCSFVNPKVNWLVPNQLRWFGWLVSQKWVSYFLMSHFRLVMEKL